MNSNTRETIEWIGNECLATDDYENTLRFVQFFFLIHRICGTFVLFIEQRLVPKHILFLIFYDSFAVAE